MADGLCMGESIDSDGLVNEKTIIVRCSDSERNELNSGSVMAAAALSIQQQTKSSLMPVVAHAATAALSEPNQNNSVMCEKSFYLNNRDKLYVEKSVCNDVANVIGDGSTITKQAGFTSGGDEDDCRKKRCVDRYDSSESSDSGVAVLSCTDCSGSSTASSDITDPGSPFSTSSNNSEDSGTSSQLPPSLSSSSSSSSTPVSAEEQSKMPPITQTAHHPWPWNEESSSATTPPSLPSSKRSIQIEKTVFPKRLKSNEDNSKQQSPSCLPSSSINNNSTTINNNKLMQPSPNSDKVINNKKQNVGKRSSSNNSCINKEQELQQQQQQQVKQGKITEYFKSQIKLHSIKKEQIATSIITQTASTKDNNNKSAVTLVDQLIHLNGVRNSIPQQNYRTTIQTNQSPTKKSADSNKNMKSKTLHHHHHITVPRKILPAPSKLPENHHQPHPHHHPHLANFPVTLTTVFPSNLTYLHTKTAKPPDVGAQAAAAAQAAATANNIFVPQFATITNDKLTGTIPIINRTTTTNTCLNVIHHPHQVQKLTTATINNFNCVKLNATVVPIVKLNTLPSRLSTAMPTVLTAKQQKLLECATVITTPTKMVEIRNNNNLDNVRKNCVVEKSLPSKANLVIAKQATPAAAVVPPTKTTTTTTSSSLLAIDSDSSGISSIKDGLEVSVEDLQQQPPDKLLTPQKSPILSQPKTIRFPPAKQEAKEEVVKDAKAQQQLDSGVCKWEKCSAQFDTNGALLEHLQVKHVISQATQEQYVCLWLGCKVHGRTSCSRSWLERHVLAHAGTKPFRCIVDGCGQRFNSQLTLERHVNGHFNGDGTQTNSAKKTTEASTTKLFKRNGKKIRFRRQPWSARMFDFIDSGIMEGLQHKLLKITDDRTGGQIHNAGGTVVNVLSQVVARRVETDGRIKYLVRWHPTNIVPDEWVLEKEFVKSKSVSIPSLQPSAKDALKMRLFPPDKRNEKRRRKPISKQQT